MSSFQREMRGGASSARVCVSGAGVCVTETKRRLYYSKHTNEGTDLLPHFRHTDEGECVDFACMTDCRFGR